MTPTLQLLAMHEADIRLQNLQCRMLLWEGKIDPVEYATILLLNEQSSEIIREQRLALLN